MKVTVRVTLKPGILDAQGQAIERALGALGYEGVLGVRQGKIIAIELDEKDAVRAQKTVAGMCDSLLANTVIEDYVIEPEQDEKAPS